jgi:hypothetical protein
VNANAGTRRVIRAGGVVLYVVYLRRDGREEVRFHDRELKVGDRLRIKGETWEVVADDPPLNPQYARRYTAEIVGDAVHG